MNEENKENKSQEDIKEFEDEVSSIQDNSEETLDSSISINKKIGGEKVYSNL